MSNYQKLAGDLMSSLELSLPPIAVSFCDEVPANVSSFDGVVAAGCVFWQKAATQTFATSTKDHELCAIGVHTLISQLLPKLRLCSRTPDRG